MTLTGHELAVWAVAILPEVSLMDIVKGPGAPDMEIRWV